MLPGMLFILNLLQLVGTTLDFATVGFQLISFVVKVAFFMWFFVWVRWTLPRFRYDQLMDLGWKVMLPLSLLNIFVTGVMIYLGWI
jgi:NADH-quinone oxidoreductase subunit H